MKDEKLRLEELENITRRINFDNLETRRRKRQSRMKEMWKKYLIRLMHRRKKKNTSVSKKY